MSYLETLNAEQRRAVQYGVHENDGAPGGPLVIIAGASSGETNTLAHRVAHLIANGAVFVLNAVDGYMPSDFSTGTSRVSFKVRR